MKTTFATICLNEAEFIGLNLRQHYDHCDEWIIVEGADKRYPRATEQGLSVDDTAEIIRSFPDPDKKIRFIQHGWAADKCELRNRYADWCDDGVVVVFDADEFLSHRDLSWLIDRCRALPRPGSVRIPHIHFWKHDRQIITGGYYDVPHDRAYRWEAGCVYRDNHNHPARSFGGELLQESFYEKFDRRLMVEPETGANAHPLPCFRHYGFAKSGQNIADKNAYYVNRGEATTRAETTRDRAAWFAEKLPPNCEVVPWIGGVPEVMQQKAVAA
jgi:hypothetical protein